MLSLFSGLRQPSNESCLTTLFVSKFLICLAAKTLPHTAAASRSKSAFYKIKLLVPKEARQVSAWLPPVTQELSFVTSSGRQPFTLGWLLFPRNLMRKHVDSSTFDQRSPTGAFKTDDTYEHLYPITNFCCNRIFASKVTLVPNDRISGHNKGRKNDQKGRYTLSGS